MKGLHNP